MEIRHHREKYERLLTVRCKLDPLQDFELWFWMSMTAATHMVNAALHHRGASSDAHYYSYHVFGLYVLPERGPEGWRRAPKPPGDIVHTGRPELPGRRLAAKRGERCTSSIGPETVPLFAGRSEPLEPVFGNQLVSRAEALRWRT